MKKILAILFALCSINVYSENNDSIDRCKFIVAYDFITNTEDIDGNPVVDSCQWGVMVGEHSTKCEEFNKIISRFRIIPFSSLGKQNGLLLGIKYCVLASQTYF